MLGDNKKATSMTRPACEHPLATVLPEELVDKIAHMAFEPHPTATMMKQLEFTELGGVPSLPILEYVDRDVSGFQDIVFEVSVRGGFDRQVYFRPPRRDDSWRPYRVCRSSYLVMNVYNVEGQTPIPFEVPLRTYRAVQLEREWRRVWESRLPPQWFP